MQRPMYFQRKYFWNNCSPIKKGTSQPAGLNHIHPIPWCQVCPGWFFHASSFGNFVSQNVYDMLCQKQSPHCQYVYSWINPIIIFVQFSTAQKYHINSCISFRHHFLIPVSYKYHISNPRWSMIHSSYYTHANFSQIWSFATFSWWCSPPTWAGQVHMTPKIYRPSYLLMFNIFNACLPDSYVTFTILYIYTYFIKPSVGSGWLWFVMVLSGWEWLVVVG